MIISFNDNQFYIPTDEHENNPSYNIYTVSGIETCIISFDDNQFYIPTDEHVITENNPSYNIYTVSGIETCIDN